MASPISSMSFLFPPTNKIFSLSFYPLFHFLLLQDFLIIRSIIGSGVSIVKCLSWCQSGEPPLWYLINAMILWKSQWWSLWLSEPNCERVSFHGQFTVYTQRQLIEDGYVNNVSYNMYSLNINVTYKLYNAVSFQQSYNHFFSPERGSFWMKLYLN